MKRFMRKFKKQFRYGEKGFTLIELLVVVAILGVLAAVIVPNVAKFIGRGTIESANTEAHNVTTAVVAYMADNNLSTFAGVIGPSISATGDLAEEFLINPAGMQADYTIVDGAITAAVKITDSKWGSLAYTVADGWA